MNQGSFVIIIGVILILISVIGSAMNHRDCPRQPPPELRDTHHGEALLKR